MKNTGVKTRSGSKGRLTKIILGAVLAVIFIMSALIDAESFDVLPKWRDIYAALGLSADMEAELSVSFVDVGTADACVIACNGKNILIDCGSSSSKDKLYAYINHYGLEHFDAAVISHFDADHYTAAADIMRDFGIDVVYTQKLNDKLTPKDEFYSGFMTAASEYGTDILYPENGDEVKIGDLKLSFIRSDGEYDNRNDLSLLVRVDYKSISALFTGDISEAAERDILSSEASIDCDILKVAHHGSGSSSCEDFLRAVSPQISVISVGSGEKSLPDYDAVARIARLSKEVYTTRDDLNIVISYNGEELKVQTKA